MRLPSDAEMGVLIRKAQAHDPHAFDEIYHWFADLIYRYGYYWTDESGLATALVNDVFARMVTLIRGMRVPARGKGHAFVGWLLSLAHTRLTEVARHRPMVHEVGLERAVGDKPVDERARRHLGMQVALRQLPVEQQQIVFLRFVERLSVEDIASMTRQSVETIRVQQHEVLATLAHLSGSAHDSRKSW